MSTVVTNTTVFTNREFPFKEISLSDTLEKRNRKYYIDYHIEDQPIFFQINKVVLVSEPIFIDDEQGYIDVEIKDRLVEISKYFEELDNFNQVSCFKNCEEWLGKKLSMDEIENVYKTSFKKNCLRLKIEKDNIRIFDFKKNKLELEKDIKVGNVLDIIIEISGLKVMKNAFATHLVLRQIRKNPEPVVLRTKLIPKEYLFIDDYSKLNNAKKDEHSIDSQTDVEVFVNRRKKNNVPPKLLEPSVVDKEEETEQQENEVDLNLDEILEESEKEKEVKAGAVLNEKTSFFDMKANAVLNEKTSFFDIEKEDDNTNDYLKSVEKLKHMMSDILDEKSSTSKFSHKDKILEKLENGDITLGSFQSEQSEKPLKKIGGPRKKTVTKASQELYKNL
jgi:hypothetical protein